MKTRYKEPLCGAICLASIGFLSSCQFIPRAGNVPIENPIGLPHDGAGWTVFVPSADSRIIYVSGAAGNDATAAVYGPADPAVGADPFQPTGAILPFRTYAAARELVREGLPDWVLFRRGETYDDIFIELASGRSAAEYALTSSYGAGALPVLHPRFDAALINGLTDSLRFCAVAGLDCYAEAHDPTVHPLPLDGGIGLGLLTGSGTIHHVLIEGVTLRCFEGNVIQTYEAGVIHDIALRRCTVLDNFQRDRANGHCQGVFVGGLSRFFVEECVFDHNGWYSQDDGIPAVELPGEATMFNHNTYVADCRDVTFRNNIFLRSASIQNKFTANLGTAGSAPNIALEGNLYVDGEIGISLGGNVDTPYKFKDIVVTGNVFTEIGRSRPTNRTLGWGLDIADWDGGLVRDNYFIHHTTPAVDNTYAVAVGGGTRNVTISGNVIYGQNETGVNDSGLGITIDHSFSKDNILITGNVIQEPASPLVLIALESPFEASVVHFRDNRYYLPGGGENGAFRIGGAVAPFSRWAAGMGDTSQFAAAAFIDPGRSIAGYDAYAGGTGSIDAFIAACRAQSRDNWDPAYTAPAVTSWLKAGFAH